MKKTLAILLLIALCLTALPAAALAISEPAEEPAADVGPIEEDIALPEEDPTEETEPAEEVPAQEPEDSEEPAEDDEEVVSEEPAEADEEVVSEEPPVAESEPEEPAADAAASDPFRIGSSTYATLDAALKAAKSGDAIVVVKSTTLAAGSYTIPSGVSLVVPFDNVESMAKYTTYPKGGTGEPYEYVRLTIPSSATIKVSGGGALCVGAGFSTENARYASVAGPYGIVRMASGSAIELESNASLYAYGYIVGEGTVIARSGSHIREYMEIRDFRGRSATSSMLENDKHVFPFTQYFVQNIEALLRLYSGASETVMVPYGETSTLTLPFVDSDGLFQLSSGYLERKYNPSTDRVSYVIRDSGRFSINSTDIFGYQSSAFVFPICSNLSFTLTSGSVMTVNNDIMMLPGSSLTIDAGANMTVRNKINVYVLDSSDWNGKGFVYSEASWGSVSGSCRSAYYVPNRLTRFDAKEPGDARLVINGTLTVRGGTKTGGIFASQGGAAIIRGSSASINDNTSAAGTLYAAKADGSYVAIPLVNLTTKNSTPGDLDGSGKVDVYDAALLLKYIVGQIDESYIDSIAADVNADGSVDVRDVYRILKM